MSIFGLNPANVINSIGQAFDALMPQEGQRQQQRPLDPAPSVAGGGFQGPVLTMGQGMQPSLAPATQGMMSPVASGFQGFSPPSSNYAAFSSGGLQPAPTFGGSSLGFAPLSPVDFGDPYAYSDRAWQTHLANEAKKAQAAKASQYTGGKSSGAGASPNVAKWATQAQQSFGDIVDPDVMLAIMENESGGDPNAYNASGDAYGLFQQVGLGSYDPNAEFAGARKLLQDKLSGIAQSYAANGLSPDERTRARDIALAWAGHFDYKTGRPNPASRDVGSNQTAEQLSAIFLGHYDRIKAASQKAPQGGGKGMASITGGQAFPIMQEYGDTDYSDAHPDTYAYAAAYGGHGHTGIDWAAPIGTQVYTPVGGTVSVVGNDHGSGYYFTNTMTQSNRDKSGEFAITLDNGDILILGHMSNISALVGQHLDAGSLVGLSGGSDGAHVHVEYRRKNPNGGYTLVDPRTMLGG